MGATGTGVVSCGGDADEGAGGRPRELSAACTGAGGSPESPELSVGRVAAGPGAAGGVDGVSAAGEAGAGATGAGGTVAGGIVAGVTVAAGTAAAGTAADGTGADGTGVDGTGVGRRTAGASVVRCTGGFRAAVEPPSGARTRRISATGVAGTERAVPVLRGAEAGDTTRIAAPT
ncbi:hypothetical protein [Salinispira pacifica]